MNVEKVKQILHDKIISRVRRPQDTMRVAYRVFGAPKNGINRASFKRSMRRLDLHLTDAEFDEIFSLFDPDHSGVVSFNEFIDTLIPKAYSRKQWVETRSEQIRSHSKDYIMPDAPNFPKSMNNFRWSLEDIENMIRDKMVAHCKRPEDQYRTGFQIFGRPKHGISVAVFKKTLRKLGISITNDEALKLMAKFDVDGSGKLDFDEFSLGVMPLDYPSEQWTAKRSKQMQRELKAKKLRVNVGVLEEHERLVQDRAKLRESQRRKAIHDRTIRFQNAQKRLIANDVESRNRQSRRQNSRGNRPRSVRSRLASRSVYKNYNSLGSLSRNNRAQSAGYSRSRSGVTLNLDETIPMATFNGNSSNLGNSILKKSSKYTRAQSAMPRNRQKAPTAEEMSKFNGANSDNDPQVQSLRKSASASALKRPYSASPISQNHLKEALEFAGSVKNLQAASRSLTAKLRSRGRPKTAMMLSGLSLRTQHRDVRAKARVKHSSGWK